MSEAQRGTAAILVVEDNPGVRLIVRRQLETLGYCVLEASGVPEAVAVLQSGETIDLLFTDLIFPGPWTGRDLARESRRLRPALPILFTSGFADGRPRAEMDGAMLLAKPYAREQLAAHVRQALGHPAGGSAAGPPCRELHKPDDQGELALGTGP